MLLIWDIHITTKHTDAILDTIAQFIDAHDTEKNIVFLGDYMYMFSYDRVALSRLFDLFIELGQRGKNLYILAGNHDRIGQQFVYAEWKKIADMIPVESRKLHFITEPELHTIEGKKILFFPFTKYMSYTQTREISALSTDWGIGNTIATLLASKNTNERLSGMINATLEQYISEHSELTIIHHYYIAHTKFPGQQALFDYKDIALCPEFLDNKNIQLISGHIHMPFSYKNYFCTWSVWYTSPLEQDHHKFLYQRETTENTIQAQQVAINPYIVLQVENEETVSSAIIEKHQEKITHSIQENFQWKRSLAPSFIPYSLSNTHVTLLSQSLWYDDLEKKVEPTLLHNVKEWMIKRKTSSSPDMSFTLEIAQKNLQESLIDRKIIVKNFIESRYWEDFEKYRTLLDELHILS